MITTYDKSSRLNIDSWDLEHARFFKTNDEKIAVRVGKVGSLIDFQWDDVTVDSSDPLKNTYNFTNQGQVAGTIEVRYTNSCKDEFAGAGKV